MLAVILGAAAMAYAPAVGGEFLFDDEKGVIENLRIQGAAEYLRTSSASTLLSGRPLTELTFALDRQRSGLEPRAFHETNLAIHLAAAVLVFLFTRTVARRARIGGETGLALAVTALFALHPIQAETVAYVSQRAEEMASVLALAALLVLFRGERTDRAIPRVVLGVAAVALFGLAIAAKQSVVAVPVLFLLAFAAFPEQADGSAAADPVRSRWPWRGTVAAVMIALASVQAAVFFDAIAGSGDAGFSIPGVDAWRYLLTQARVVPLYARLVAWPAGLNADRDVALSQGLLDPAATLAGALTVLGLLAAATGGLLWTRRGGRGSASAPAVRMASFGVLWFFLLLAPTSTVVPLADVAVEHRVYLAAWGLLVGAAVLAREAARRLPPALGRAALAGAGVAAAVALALALHARAGVWSSALELWTDTAAKSPRKARVHANLGHARHGRGDLAGALDAYETARSLDDRSLDAPIVVHNMGTALLGLGRLPEARAVLLAQQPPDPETLVLLVDIDLADGRVADAAEKASILTRFASRYPRAQQAAARVALAQGDLQSARMAFMRSLALFPADPGALLEIGRIELRLGDAAAACRDWRAATRAPGNAWAGRWAQAELARAGCP